MPAKKKAETVSQVVVPPIDVRRMDVVLIGDSPLVTHPWSEKQRKQIEGNVGGGPKPGRAPKVAEEEYQDAFYRTDDGKPAMVTLAFKNAMVTAAKDAELKMTDMRRRLHVLGDLAEIVSDDPWMRTDMVRVGMGGADIRYRPQFDNWSIKLTIQYMAPWINEAVIVNLLNLAGFGVGIGEHRPEKNGQWGRFHVANAEELEKLQKKQAA